MSARSYQLTITAAAQSLAVALSDATRGGKADEAFRHLWLSADTDCFIGAAATITTSSYGVKIFAATASTYPIELGPFDTGPMKLSDLYVIGTSGVLHIFGIPF